MPGPKEQNPDQVQQFMCVLVSELLDLWENGLFVRTPKHPEERLMRVALVGICCDKPAAYKLGGFGSHSRVSAHNAGLQKDKVTPKAFADDGMLMIIYIY